MAKAGSSPSGTSRLPSYRSTQNRLHPYSMASRRRDEDYLMTTVDRRGALGGLEPIIEEPEAVSLSGPLVPFGELPDCGPSACAEGRPEVDGDLARQSEGAPCEPMQAASGHRKFVVAFVNMMFALRHKYRELLAGADLPRDMEVETK
ncbi:hypothetical protein K466DRAFT_586386 [Polyporus arcularius HHB13444]|uniref:Uncharacterized protein n=1 Tax=Polyporus arcularius HHB13444 TaxID=1314778 RepID=A0A5C3PCX0_9APHY|nr:hypothetical protein K466DRAFT_586386 [Polyporus arcularius HHB13444]